MAKASYAEETRQRMLEDEVDAWWMSCPWCDYEGPEPPIPGLEPLPGHHEVFLCPSCKGRLEPDHLEVVRVRTKEPKGASDD